MSGSTFTTPDLWQAIQCDSQLSAYVNGTYANLRPCWIGGEHDIALDDWYHDEDHEILLSVDRTDTSSLVLGTYDVFENRSHALEFATAGELIEYMQVMVREHGRYNWPSPRMLAFELTERLSGLDPSWAVSWDIEDQAPMSYLVGTVDSMPVTHHYVLDENAVTTAHLAMLVPYVDERSGSAHTMSIGPFMDDAAAIDALYVLIRAELNNWQRARQ